MTMNCAEDIAGGDPPRKVAGGASSVDREELGTKSSGHPRFGF
jgi:hypothetical protein